MAAERLITVIGRGNSGTRLLSQALAGSDVFLGKRLNESGDTVPPEAMYEACRVIGRHVKWLGGLEWDFEQLHTMPIEPEFEDLVRSYLSDILASDRTLKGWKLPETTLAFPWIARMFPEAWYVQIVRDPRDCLLGAHVTDNLRLVNVGCPSTDDLFERRVVSWKYQHEIVKATPRPRRFLSVRYEELVTEHDRTMQRLEDFLEIPLARLVVDESRIGRWRQDSSLLPYIAPLEAAMREYNYVLT